MLKWCHTSECGGCERAGDMGEPTRCAVASRSAIVMTLVAADAGEPGNRKEHERK